MLCEAFPMQHDYEGKIWRSLVITGMGLTAIATLLALQRSSWEKKTGKSPEKTGKQIKKRPVFQCDQEISLFSITTYKQEQDKNSSPHKFILIFFSFFFTFLHFTTMMNLKIVKDDYKIKYFCMINSDLHSYIKSYIYFWTTDTQWEI